MAEDLERYNSPLTGAQVDVALQDMAQRISERYAKGTANGVPVTTGQIGYQDNAKYYANLAQSAVPAGVDGAVLWSQNQLLTDEQKTVARTNIGATDEAYINRHISNPNLLDNAWFTVNQRGQTEYISNTSTYTFDRWYMVENSNAGGVKVAKANEGIVITKLTTANNPAGRLAQKFENDLIGNTVTFSITYKSTISFILGLGTTYGGAISPSLTMTPSSEFVTKSFTVPISTSGLLWFNIAIANVQPQGTIEIKAIKLELGTVSTLANDIAPNYAEELAKCQRYYVRFSGNAAHLGSGFFTSNSAVQIDIPLPATMREIKDVSNALSGTAYIWTTSHIGSGSLATTVGGTGRVANNIASFQFSVSGTAGQPALLQLRDTTSYIEISCDL